MEKIRIRGKHPGSATLYATMTRLREIERCVGPLQVGSQLTECKYLPFFVPPRCHF
jgi:hypothetical protein